MASPWVVVDDTDDRIFYGTGWRTWVKQPNAVGPGGNTPGLVDDTLHVIEGYGGFGYTFNGIAIEVYGTQVIADPDFSIIPYRCLIDNNPIPPTTKTFLSAENHWLYCRATGLSTTSSHTLSFVVNSTRSPFWFDSLQYLPRDAVLPPDPDPSASAPLSSPPTSPSSSSSASSLGDSSLASTPSSTSDSTTASSPTPTSVTGTLTNTSADNSPPTSVASTSSATDTPFGTSDQLNVNQGQSSSTKPIAIGASIGAICFIALLLFIWFLIRRRDKARQMQTQPSLSPYTDAVLPSYSEYEGHPEQFQPNGPGGIQRNSLIVPYEKSPSTPQDTPLGQFTGYGKLQPRRHPDSVSSRAPENTTPSSSTSSNPSVGIGRDSNSTPVIDNSITQVIPRSGKHQHPAAASALEEDARTDNMSVTLAGSVVEHGEISERRRSLEVVRQTLPTTRASIRTLPPPYTHTN
ncbi:hypothetical protein CVT24_002349 [Panaeolus cyanescens]|uniref:Uncharacterized protein n=1 Tax=Panaeolus cyanescens TaxID=181874 RepID=A0A409W150_9AGAR|nr:hypothetical protein CVT24_002349 [Panaeolus cyanescens]